MKDREWCSLPPRGVGTLGLQKKTDLNRSAVRENYLYELWIELAMNGDCLSGYCYRIGIAMTGESLTGCCYLGGCWTMWGRSCTEWR